MARFDDLISPGVLSRYWSAAPDEVLSALSSGAAGLTSAEAKQRLKEYGLNSLEIHRRVTPLRLFIKQLVNPLNLILLFAVAVSLFVGETTDAVVILIIVMGSATISFVQEYSAGNAVAKLRARLTQYVTVVRDGQPERVAVQTVVPGDVLMMSAGTLIPADGIVLESQDCFVNQAVLTGETFPCREGKGQGTDRRSVVGPHELRFYGDILSQRYGTSSDRADWRSNGVWPDSRPVESRPSGDRV